MSYNEIREMLEGCGIPFANRVWRNPPELPWGVYSDSGSSMFYADGVAYYQEMQISASLYFEQEDPVVESLLQSILEEHGFPYERTVEYIDSEQMIEVTYEFEVK